MRYEKDVSIKLLFQSLIVGVLVGCIVGFFRFGIEETSSFWLWAFKQAHQHLWILGLIIVGYAAIGLLAGYFVKQYPHVGGSGIPEVKLQLQGKLNLKWWPILWRKLISGILVIGTGLFLGPEGPSLQLGSTVGQGVGEKSKQSRTNRRVLLATGAASGLAAAFGAPLSGALFVLEEVFHNFSARVWMNALIGALASDYVITNIFGQKPALMIAYKNYFPTQLYWHLVILGLLLGFCGHYYKVGLFKMKAAYMKLKIIPRWLHGLIPLAILVPIMWYVPIVTGPGNRMILSLPKLIKHDGWALVGMLAAFFVLRLVFSIVSYDSGLPSGIFLPILTMGALFGATYGLLMAQLGLMPRYLVVNLIIYSMAGFFAATIRAPFTAIILITEMVGSLLHLMPLALVSFFALLVDVLLGGLPIYDSLAKAMEPSYDQDEVSGQADQLTVAVFESSALVDKTIAEITWPPHTLVKVIKRRGSDIIPNGETKLEPGDLLVLAIDESQRGYDYDAIQALQEGKGLDTVKKL
ncbi:ClC family H(+)/Cl(-) exchange transporter [Lactobacillus corticis]|uniref:Chloride channel protein n=1 Tax=Lactobacillus corticis TaxID=2201249 RepID=A0A916QFT9_9LACO|nr:ClC family H(+)/Cl(-) exchange transporter [Lactobacillus corticis]GFZ26525.1 chloride channel protein [Lactobacillus corticis]